MKLVKLVAALLFSAGAVSAHAGYAQVAPPPGWQATTTGNFYRAAANESWLLNTVRTSGALNVGGRAVAMPAAMRLAANAPRFLALAVAPAFPAGLAVAGLTAAAILLEPAFKEWLSPTVRFNESGKVWEVRESGGAFYRGGRAQCFGSDGISVGRCDLRVSNNIPDSDLSNCTMVQSGGSGISFSVSCTYVPTGSRLQDTISKTELDPVWKPKTPQEIVPYIENNPVPADLPNKLPISWPVEPPVLNPSPGANPSPQPLRVPTGDPVPVPNTDPQQYRQPSVQIVPSPAPSSPWRVDVRPEEVTTTDPEGIKDPVPVTPESPEGERTEDDFCTKNPGSIACEQGDVTDTGLPAVPKLYEPKYPDGLVGVWNAKKAELDATPISSVLTKLMPTGLQGSGYPVFRIDMDLGVVDFGEFDASVPEYVWNFCGLVMVLSALLLARRLIFGG